LLAFLSDFRLCWLISRSVGGRPERAVLHNTDTDTKESDLAGPTTETATLACDGASDPSSYQLRSVSPVRAAVLHRSRPTDRTQDTVVTPSPRAF